MFAGQALLDVPLLQLRQEHLHISLEFAWVLDAPSRQVVVHILTTQLLQRKFTHQALGQRDLLC